MSCWKHHRNLCNIARHSGFYGFLTSDGTVSPSVGGSKHVPASTTVKVLADEDDMGMLSSISSSSDFTLPPVEKTITLSARDSLMYDSDNEELYDDAVPAGTAIMDAAAAANITTSSTTSTGTNNTTVSSQHKLESDSLSTIDTIDIIPRRDSEKSLDNLLTLLSTHFVNWYQKYQEHQQSIESGATTSLEGTGRGYLLLDIVNEINAGIEFEDNLSVVNISKLVEKYQLTSYDWYLHLVQTSQPFGYGLFKYNKAQLPQTADEAKTILADSNYYIGQDACGVMLKQSFRGYFDTPHILDSTVATTTTIPATTIPATTTTTTSATTTTTSATTTTTSATTTTITAVAISDVAPSAQYLVRIKLNKYDVYNAQPLLYRLAQHITSKIVELH